MEQESEKTEPNKAHIRSSSLEQQLLQRSTTEALRGYDGVDETQWEVHSVQWEEPETGVRG